MREFNDNLETGRSGACQERAQAVRGYVTVRLCFGLENQDRCTR